MNARLTWFRAHGVASADGAALVRALQSTGLAMASSVTWDELDELIEPALPPPSWRAVWAGAVATLTTGFALYGVAFAVGIAAWSAAPTCATLARRLIDLSSPWIALVSVPALFVGGFIASRWLGPVRRAGGALHGLALWGLLLMVGLWMTAGALVVSLVRPTWVAGTELAITPLELVGVLALALLSTVAGGAIGVRRVRGVADVVDDSTWARAMSRQPVALTTLEAEMTEMIDPVAAPTPSWRPGESLIGDPRRPPDRVIGLSAVWRPGPPAYLRRAPSYVAPEERWAADPPEPLEPTTRPTMTLRGWPGSARRG